MEVGKMVNRDVARLLSGSIEVRRVRGSSSLVGSRNRSLSREIVSSDISGARLSRVGSSHGGTCVASQVGSRGGGARACAVSRVTDVTDAAARMKRAQRVVARMSRATLSHVTFVTDVTVARRAWVMGG